MSYKLHEELTQFLKKNIDLEYKKNYSNFFKESIKFYGVRSEIIDKLVKEYYNKIKEWSLKDQLKFLYQLLNSGYQEEILISLKILYKLESRLIEKDFKTLEDILNKYIKNWATCDELCTHALGKFLYRYPQFFSYIKTHWSGSNNLWKRRALAVSLIYSLRQVKTKNKKYLNKSFLISKLLLKDNEDLVQKAYGWLLKEASNYFQKEVFEFVNKLKTQMPRTALRYAIEKMPKNLKQEAMKK